MASSLNIGIKKDVRSGFWKASLSCSWPCPTFLSLPVCLVLTLEGPSTHRFILLCLPRIQLAPDTLRLAQFPSAATSRSTWSSRSLPLVSQTAPHWSPCSARIWTQPLLLCGPEAQAGPFVLRDKSKKGGHGRRISLSPAQTTHLLVVVISCLSLLWFLLLSFLLSLVRAEDIGSECTVNPQSRDTSLPPFPFFCPLATAGHNYPYFC